MQNLPFTIRQLVIFEALAETRSFRRAAETLNISQASVSNQIKVLEAKLGIALMLRQTGKRPVLTHEGENFLADLRAFRMTAHKLASHRRRGLTVTEPRRYRVLLGQGLADNYIKPKLESFLSGHRGIILEFDTRAPSKQPDLAARCEQYDFVFIHQHAELPFRSPMRSLGRTQSAIHGDRRFAEGRKLPLTAEAVSRLPFVLPTTGNDPQQGIAEDLLTAAGVKPSNIVGRVQYFDIIISMIDRGLAVTHLPGAMIPVKLRTHIVPLFPMEDWRLMYYRRTSENDPGLDAVERFLLESVLNDPGYQLIEEGFDPTRLIWMS